MKWILASLILCFSVLVNANVFTPQDIRVLKANFMENITANGAIMASPSQDEPDYYYDWVRDSAIAMGLIASWYETQLNPHDKKLLQQYVQWVETIQHQPTPINGSDILGEPKFYLDGRPYDGPWGRPQNDGPALRALALTKFANQLLKNNETNYVRTHLYGGGLNPMTMGTIKMDLEYLAHHWQEKNFDLWEEVYGHHFFTAMVQRKALLEGAALARKLEDPKAAVFYERQANRLKQRLNLHIDSNQGTLLATLPPHTGPQKYQELDSAVLLAVLLGYQQDGFFAPDNPYLIATIEALKKQFKELFPVNDRHHKAILFGRYPGDTYDGYHTDGLGNPWFILTASMAEYHYRLADMHAKQNGTGNQIEEHIQQGDAYLKLIKHYTKDLHMKEQINRATGKQQGAASLTWNYVAVLRAIEARSAIRL